MAKSDIDLNMAVLKNGVRDVVSYELDANERQKVIALSLAGLSLLHQFLLDIHAIAQKNNE